jgi:hypothetical protein
MTSGDVIRSLAISGGVVVMAVVVVYFYRQRFVAGFAPVMTYKQAVGYMAANQSADGRIVKGAMYRDTHPRGFLFTQVFMDESNNVVLQQDGKPYGRKIIVGRFDSELEAAFGTKNVVIVE